MDTTDKTKSAISTSALSTPQIPFQLAQLPDLSNVYNSATNLGASVVQAGEVSALANKNEQQALDKQMATSDAVSSLTLQKGQQGNDLAQAYQQGGVNDLYKQLSGLNVEAQGLQRESQASPIQTQLESIGRGRTDAGIAPLDAAKRQDIALRSLELGQRAAIAQGNYDVAKNLADQQVNAKYAQIDAEIAARKINEEALYKNVTDPAIKKALEARMALTKKEEQMQAEKKASDLAVSNMLIEASPVAPKDVLARATEVQKRGGSAVEVARALGEYGGDYYKTALLKEQIETQKSARATDAAQRAKIYSDMAVTASTQSKAEADSWVANIASGRAKLSDVPAKLKSLVSLGLSTATISSPENKTKIDASQSVYDLAQELKTLSGKGGAVGAGAGKFFGSIIPGYDGTAFAGSDRANYEAKFKQLKDTLAASNLDKLKGAMSDKDIEFLRNIGTSLTLDMGETAFDVELDKVSNTMATVPGVKATVKPTYNKFNQSLGQSASPIGGTTYVKSVGDDGSIEFNIPTK